MISVVQYAQVNFAQTVINSYLPLLVSEPARPHSGNKKSLLWLNIRSQSRCWWQLSISHKYHCILNLVNPWGVSVKWRNKSKWSTKSSVYLPFAVENPIKTVARSSKHIVNLYQIKTGLKNNTWSQENTKMLRDNKSQTLLSTLSFVFLHSNINYLSHLNLNLVCEFIYAVHCLAY